MIEEGFGGAVLGTIFRGIAVLLTATTSLPTARTTTTVFEFVCCRGLSSSLYTFLFFPVSIFCSYSLYILQKSGVVMGLSAE